MPFDADTIAPMVLIEFFTQRESNAARHSGAGRNPARNALSCTGFWTPACAGVTELPFSGLLIPVM
jgi:hypothetical protein